MHLFLTVLITLLLYAAGTVFYLKYSKKKEAVSAAGASAPAGSEDSASAGEDTPEEEQKAPEAEESAPAAVHTEASGKQTRNSLVYLGIMAVLTVGLGIWLNLYYRDNILLTNLKAVTLIAILAVAALTDFRKHLIPNELVLAGLGLRLVYAILEFIVLKMDYIQILKGDLFSLILPLAMMLLGVFVVKNGVGMGDVKLLAVIGIFAGLSGAIPSLFFALVIAFLLSIVLMIMKKKGRKDTIAFAPSLLAGTFVAIVLTGL